MKSVRFVANAFQQYVEWGLNDSSIHFKINELIKDTCRTPFKGLGKPEPLKGNFKGCWSRRITGEHRLIYRVEEDDITIISCKYHYK